jgi:hypothetical protein
MGAAGRAGVLVLAAGLAFDDVGVAGDSDVDDGPRAGVGDAFGCGVLADVLRVLVGRRLVCALDTEEKTSSRVIEKRKVRQKGVD